jgi:hypothetical protein
LVDVKGLKLPEIQKRLRQDLKVLTVFVCESSSPYQKLFKDQNNQDE